MDTQDVTESTEEKVDAAPEGQISESERTILELKDQLLRALAETENTRRRGQKEKEDALKSEINMLKQNVSELKTMIEIIFNKLNG